jgi:hypothetical protein
LESTHFAVEFGVQLCHARIQQIQRGDREHLPLLYSVDHALFPSKRVLKELRDEKRRNSGAEEKLTTGLTREFKMKTQDRIQP